MAAGVEQQEPAGNQTTVIGLIFSGAMGQHYSNAPIDTIKTRLQKDSRGARSNSDIAHHVDLEGHVQAARGPIGVLQGNHAASDASGAWSGRHVHRCTSI